MREKTSKIELDQIDIERWRYTLYESPDSNLIGDFVYSPTSAVDVSMLIELTEDEKINAKKRRQFLIDLSDDVRNNFKKFLPRALNRDRFNFINRNDLIDNFSFSMGNRMADFMKYAEAKGISNEKIKQLVSVFENLQNKIYDYIYQLTEGNKQLSSNEIEKECEEYCNIHVKWINKDGIKAINRWLVWMCWHEGILKKSN